MMKLHRWIFSTGRPETLAAIRVYFSLIAFFVIAIQLPLLRDFYGETGLFPAAANDLWSWRGQGLNPLKGAPPAVMYVWWAAGLLAAGCAAAGLRTNVALVLLWICIQGFQSRNPLILNSGDTLLKLIIAYLALSRCGAAYSIDARRRRLNGLPAIDRIPLWPQRLIQIQVAILYLAATWFKAQGPLWRSGLVVYYVLRLEELRRIAPPGFLLSATASKVLTWGTLLLELALATLVWFKRYRTPVLIAGVCLHLGFGIFLNIPFFGLITIGCYLSFYTGEEIREIFSGISRSPALHPHPPCAPQFKQT